MSEPDCTIEIRVGDEPAEKRHLWVTIRPRWLPWTKVRVAVAVALPEGMRYEWRQETRP